ncbi:MAG: class I SAM-dependent DNA methyltransferase [Planctomycetaceae bacterium]|nr:class I SAM-dependent DNA methyltransferase [Planctomycetaceae bacterium]
MLEPVVMVPLRREWADVQAKCEALWPKIQEESRKQAKSAGTRRKASKPRAAFDKLLSDFVHRLAHVRILDPACGSGNFLYVAIHLLLDLEKTVIAYGASHGLTQLPQVRPTQLAGIEINPYAQELAQVVIWIGYLQWMHHNGFNPPRNPVLDPIEGIRCMDAILDLTEPDHPFEPEWPEADFIVGNPPFLGGKRLRTELTDGYVDKIFSVYADRVPREADLVAYWFEKARAAIQSQRCRVGLLATQSIRAGANRQVLERIKQSGDIFLGWADQPWILDGAAVRVSIVGFDDGSESEHSLDGHPVVAIHSNLSAAAADVTKAKPGLLKMPRHQNSWVNFGVGRSDRV